MLPNLVLRKALVPRQHGGTAAIDRHLLRMPLDQRYGRVDVACKKRMLGGLLVHAMGRVPFRSTLRQYPPIGIGYLGQAFAQHFTGQRMKPQPVAPLRAQQQRRLVQQAD
jgi:hypothetical protein